MRSDDRNEAAASAASSIENRPMAAPPRARASDASDRAAEPQKMTAAEQRDADNKKFFAEARKKADELTKEQEAINKEAEGASAANMKLWIVEPMNADDAPFMYSNVANRVLVAAPSERVARHRVFVDQGDDWRDESKVKVSEMKLERSMIITRDFRG
jgi:hypothetical protein